MADVRHPHSSHSFGELALLDEPPACALRSATVVARTGNTEDVADHHVLMRRNALPQLAQEVVLLDAAWPHERADVVPVRIVQRHHRPIPTEADDMAVLAQLDEIEQLHRTLADLQCLIHVERVHDHSGFLAGGPTRPPAGWTTQRGTRDLCDLHSLSSLGRRLLPDDVPAHDGGVALVAQPAIPGDPIEVALPQRDNLAHDLGGLLEGDAITLLEGRGGHSLSLSSQILPSVWC